MNHFVVIDTNIWVSGLLHRGSPHDVLCALRSRSAFAYITSDLMQELRSVLERAKFLATLRKRSLTPDQALAEVERVSVLLPYAPLPYVPALRDEDDLHVLACAKASMVTPAPAAAIITGDPHLLEIESFEGIPILRAPEWLTRRHKL